MADENKIEIPSFWVKQSYFPQFSFVTDSFNMGTPYIPDFNPFATGFYLPSISQIYSTFDFSLSNFNIPTLSPGTSVFNFAPTLPFNNFVLQPPQQIVQATPIEHKTNSNDNVDKTVDSYEPENTDAEEVSKRKAQPPVQQIQASNPNTQRAVAGLDSKTYIAEEISPGCYVHKGKSVNTKDLKPYMKEILAKLSKKAEELGYTLVVTDGYRSHTAQVDLKRRKPGLAATPGKSAHEYGVAIDVSLFKDGKFAGDIYKNVPEFGRYAQSLGLEWGATWRTKYEPWHFNMQEWKELADVRNEYRQYNHLA